MGRMKSFIVPLLMIVMVVSVILSSCGAPAPAPPEPAPPAPAPPAPEPAPPAPAPPAPEPAPPAEAEFPYTDLALKPDGTPYYFGQSMHFLYNPWCVFAYQLFESFIGRSGARYTSLDANMDITKQLADLEDFVVKDIDGLVFTVIDEVAIAPGIETVIAAGIPVYNYDNIVKVAGMQMAVTYDQVEMGRVAGAYAVEYYEAKGIHGKVFECCGALTFANHWHREEGVLTAFEGHDVELVIGPDCAWSDELCANAVMDAFGADPELNGVYAPGGMLMGACEGLEAVGIDPVEVGIFGCNSDDSTTQLILEGKVTGVAHNSPGRLVDFAMKAMLWEVVIGKPVTDFCDREVLLPVIVVTKDKLDAEIESGNIETWGLVMLMGTPYIDLMPYDTSDLLPTPTVADRMEFAGY
jgi:ABC-type sugar transport system substrate-binding protein